MSNKFKNSKGAASSLSERGATSSLSARDEVRGKTSITTVKCKPTTTYKVAPLSLRLSDADKLAIQTWVDELQEKTSRKVSAAKLFRALHKIKDDIDDDVLLSIINEMR